MYKELRPEQQERIREQLGEAYERLPYFDAFELSHRYKIQLMKRYKRSEDWLQNLINAFNFHHSPVGTQIPGYQSVIKSTSN